MADPVPPESNPPADRSTVDPGAAEEHEPNRSAGAPAEATQVFAPFAGNSEQPDDSGSEAERDAAHQTVARLHHTNIVPIFAVGSEQGVNYYAMQLIDGKSLAQVLGDRSEAGVPISADDVAEWGLQAAEALAHAHSRGVIHRDVKPSNLLIDNEEGRIWLTDFDLAKRHRWRRPRYGSNGCSPTTSRLPVPARWQTKGSSSFPASWKSCQQTIGR